jgi:multidrug efflux pump subunit AcrA (membrane-fusion protein)
MSTEITKVPATGIAWFNLSRHDDSEPTDPEPAPDPADNPADPDPEPDPADDPADPEREPEPDDANALGEAGKKALDRMKAERAAAKKEAAAAKKQLAELTRKVEAFEDRDKSELEKASNQAERAQKQAAKAVSRAVSSEVKVLAVGQFADPSDAVDVLMRDPSKYVDADGEIDTDAIEADLADLLERKPHWGKPEPAAPTPEKKPQPKPDPGQGSRGASAKVDFRTASDEEYAAELARYGVRKRY